MKLQIKPHLKKARMSQAELATKLGISAGYMSDLANGKKTPSLQLLEQMADCLSTSVASLTDGLQLHMDNRGSHLEWTGFAEPSVVPLKGYTRADASEISRFHKLKTRHPAVYTATADFPMFAILHDDLLIVDLAGEPENGDLVVATVANEVNDQSHTQILRTIGGFYFSGALGGPEVKQTNTTTISTLARIIAIIRTAR